MITPNKYKVRIMKKKSGPIVVVGPVSLTDDAGNVYETKKAFSLCGCGRSGNLPFCDESHKLDQLKT